MILNVVFWGYKFQIIIIYEKYCKYTENIIDIFRVKV